MGWGEYARSKTPLKLVFILIAAVLVNSFIIEGFRLMLQYRYTAPIDIAVLSQMNEEYENALILDSKKDDTSLPLWEGEYTAYLLETDASEVKLVIVEKHFLLDRYRYLEKFAADVPFQDGAQPISPGTLHHQAICWITDNSTIDSFSMGQNYGPNISLALIPMIIAEYIAYIFLFKREEIL